MASEPNGQSSKENIQNNSASSTVSIAPSDDSEIQIQPLDFSRKTTSVNLCSSDLKSSNPSKMKWKNNYNTCPLRQEGFLNSDKKYGNSCEHTASPHCRHNTVETSTNGNVSPPIFSISNLISSNDLQQIRYTFNRWESGTNADEIHRTRDSGHLPKLERIFPLAARETSNHCCRPTPVTEKQLRKRYLQKYQLAMNVKSVDPRGREMSKHEETPRRSCDKSLKNKETSSLPWVERSHSNRMLLDFPTPNVHLPPHIPRISPSSRISPTLVETNGCSREESSSREEANDAFFLQSSFGDSSSGSFGFHQPHDNISGLRNLQHNSVLEAERHYENSVNPSLPSTSTDLCLARHQFSDHSNHRSSRHYSQNVASVSVTEGRAHRRRGQPVPEHEKDDNYRQKRLKNNASAKKSRQIKKMRAKENENKIVILSNLVHSLQQEIGLYKNRETSYRMLCDLACDTCIEKWNSMSTLENPQNPSR
ncbi:hypothetical protein NPIL_471821 [Nephila pilipes]|uniref:BZIP domain-containing protein n=1 Tax=Nephila pilipes TaxID=299642 RepID=A0A8X6N4F4_NEPPI|nr:hypothetical protein NPIL_471821 [Nephila pilipes]